MNPKGNMTDPIEVYRKELIQRLQLAHSQGGWEGTHTDFKRQLASTPRDIGKMIKHILAFANTPRRTDAFIIFGVEEDRDRGVFEHIGTGDQGFPAPERIYALLQEYTSLRDVVVDAHCVIAGKRTPFIAIPLQYEGPYVLSRTMAGAASAVAPDVIYCRYGSSSLRATERDVRRMVADWDRWFLDCRYEKNATSLLAVLASRFPRYTSLVDTGDYIRLVYNSEITDELGTQVVPVLLHAYWGFDPLEPSAVDKLVADNQQVAFQRTIIGPRFAATTRAHASASTVRCIALDEIYFVNDVYAKFCRSFMQKLADEKASGNRGLVVDLDYRIPSENGKFRETTTSILSFLEEQLQRTGRTAIVVHGAFGCGKTTTAKQLVYDLAEDYLRGHSDMPKAIYVDVNNIDIRSRRDECIESQLVRYRLSRPVIEGIVEQVRNDEIHLVFDGVDEMARPYTASGRLEAVEILRDLGNRRPAAYFVRSSYYPQLSELLTDFSRLADLDFKTGEKRVVSAEIRALRAEQVTDYLESRLGADETHAVRSVLHRLGMISFLSDPLIISLIADLVEKEGTDVIATVPSGEQKAHFLRYVVTKLLEREQDKRQRHGALAADFRLFQRVLRTVAFRMIAAGVPTVEPERLEAFVQAALGTAVSIAEAIDAFRTVSWIHHSDDGSLAFRHEALTLVCAAEYVCTALEFSDRLALSDWQVGTRLADILYEYSGEMISSVGLLGALALLGSDVQLNVRHLVLGVLQAAKMRVDFPALPGDRFDARILSSIISGCVDAPHVAKQAVRVLLASLGEKRAVEVGVPLLWLLARNESREAVELAVQVLEGVSGSTRHFCGVLRLMKENKTTWLDALLLKELGVSKSSVLDSAMYNGLFERMCALPSVPKRVAQYTERTLTAIEGEQQRRTGRLKANFTHNPRR